MGEWSWGICLNRRRVLKKAIVCVDKLVKNSLFDSGIFELEKKKSLFVNKDLFDSSPTLLIWPMFFFILFSRLQFRHHKVFCDLKVCDSGFDI